jgi:hypothetical protein
LLLLGGFSALLMHPEDPFEELAEVNPVEPVVLAQQLK